MPSAITLCTPEHLWSLQGLLAPYGLAIDRVASGQGIPGSYWGDCEAGLISDTLFLRDDTPLHSALHEACHYICMDLSRRSALHTDAGGDDAEENAVCYLQGVLADRLAHYDRLRLFADMDTWGYSFRLGAARRWFEQDAGDARAWLLEHNLIDNAQRPTGLLRQ